MIAQNRKTSFIALGSNLGNKKLNLIKAIHNIAILGKLQAVSPFFANPAMTNRQGFRQAPYLNAVVCLKTHLLPFGLLKGLQRIEQGLGRDKRHAHHAPRQIDLDIIYYGQSILRHPDLVIPHPHRLKRNFVLLPLVSIAPHWHDPCRKTSILALSKTLSIFSSLRAYRCCAPFIHPDLLPKHLFEDPQS